MCNNNMQKQQQHALTKTKSTFHSSLSATFLQQHATTTKRHATTPSAFATCKKNNMRKQHKQHQPFKEQNQIQTIPQL